MAFIVAQSIRKQKKDGKQKKCLFGFAFNCDSKMTKQGDALQIKQKNKTKKNKKKKKEKRQ